MKNLPSGHQPPQKSNLLYKVLPFFFLLLCLLLSPINGFGQKSKITHDKNGGSYYRSGNKVTYKWEYIDWKGDPKAYQLSLIFRRGWYKMQGVYRKLQHQHGGYNRFVYNDPFKRDLKVLANQLRQLAWSNGGSEVDLALSFVQALPYQSSMGGYQRYAVETLIDAKGDCSDTAVLFAGIMAAWGYSCIFLNFPNHLAVGVWSLNDIPGGTYWEYRGRKYYYCETTGTGWRLGSSPEKYQGWADLESVSVF